MFSATKGGSPSGYQISRSVRLRSSASAYLNRTPASATNRRTFTWSGWVKRGASGDGTGSNHFFLFTAGTSTAFCAVDFYQNNIRLNFGNGTYLLVTSAVYRDYSSWYHIVVSVDTTQTTDTNRVKLYINGTQVTAFSTAIYPIQNYDTAYNNTVAQRIAFDGASNYFDGYLTEVNFIDGQALTPSSFGETNTVTGVWQPKKYTGTYGTNGFYLNFSDNSGVTATTIGKDYSGNGNNFTPNNISVTAGATYDSMLDVPTQWADGGNGRGNYSTMNPLDYVAAAFSGTASNGNLTISIPAPTNSNGLASTIRVVSAAQPKFYIETTITALNTVCSLGMISGTNANYRLRHTADITLAVNDVVMTAFDPATGNVWYGRNGTWLSSGNPAAGTNPFSTIPADQVVGSAYSILATNGSTGTFTTSTTFGQQPFTYTPPTGFKALNTLNLPTPTILKGNQYFDATTYTGNGSTQTIVNSGAMQPDLLWAKARSSATHGALVDSVRGVDKYLYSSLTIAEETQTTALSSFNSNGFSFAGSFGNVNANGTTYVGWQWKANGTPAVTNTAGSITSTVSAGATQGFSVVTYTGTGANATVGHGLGVAPSMIIFKSRSLANGWPVYHASFGNTGCGYLNNTTSFASNVSSLYFNNTSPTSSVFTVGSYTDVNNSAATYVAYCFAPVAGFSKFGSYTGNGSADGPFVFCGFRPRWVMVKCSSSAGESWWIIDSVRGTYNVLGPRLSPNLSNAEATGVNFFDFTANGFKVRDSGSHVNLNAATYIYAAFAENPLKFSLAR